MPTIAPAALAHPRPRLRRSAGFWCGLMVLVFLLGTWALGSRESQLFLFQTGGGKSIWAFNLDGRGLGFRHTRSIPPPPGFAPYAAGSSCAVISERMPLPQPLGWERYEDYGSRVTRAFVCHWFLLAVHGAVWGGVMYGRYRRWGR